MSRVLHLMRKELIELRQDPRLFGIVILAPIIQLTILGYAATTDVKDVPMVVVDPDSVSSVEVTVISDAPVMELDVLSAVSSRCVFWPATTVRF